MRARFAVLAAALTAVAASACQAGERRAVVELFTSQSCYSCPPAESLLGELAARDDVLALEFHVDYWDSLVYGAAGKWRDVFSKRAYTERQVVYNRRIRGRSGVYTPQIVIDGRWEAVGSDRGAVLSAIDGAGGSARVDVKIVLAAGEGMRVELAGKAAPSEVWLVRFIGRSLTKVRAGENKGKDLVNHNVVTELRHVGSWNGSGTTLSVPKFALARGEGCAVLVQDRRQSPVIGAALCPDPVS